MANVEGKRKAWSKKKAKVARMLKANQMKRIKRELELASSETSNDIGNVPNVINIEEYDSAWRSMQLSQEGMPALEPCDTAKVSKPPVKKRISLPESAPSPTKILISMVSDLASQLEHCKQELAEKTEQLIYAEARFMTYENMISRLEAQIDDLKKCSIAKEN